MDAQVRRMVRERAGHSCEYCQRRQSESILIPLHVEHIIPRKHGGTDDIGNLALACPDCNFHKSSNLAGFDPATNTMTRLFHPRRDRWQVHFQWNGAWLVGLTDVGRTTVQVLNLNSSTRIRVRLVTDR